MLTQEEIKKKLGTYAAGLIPANSIIGLGTGSTVYWLIKELATRIQQGFQLKIVPTSSSTQELADQHGIEVVQLNDVDSLAMTIDGADEVDQSFDMIKGGGGALLQEKMVAAGSEKLIIIADESKLGSEELEVLFTPGHSPGSVSFYYEAGGFVIGGDVLFNGSIGRTDLPGGDYGTLINSIQTKLFTLPDETKVYSGHGTVTTVGFEKMNNPFVKLY